MSSDGHRRPPGGAPTAQRDSHPPGSTGGGGGRLVREGGGGRPLRRLRGFAPPPQGCRRRPLPRLTRRPHPRQPVRQGRQISAQNRTALSLRMSAQNVFSASRYSVLRYLWSAPRLELRVPDVQSLGRSGLCSVSRAQGGQGRRIARSFDGWMTPLGLHLPRVCQVRGACRGWGMVQNSR